MKILHVATTLGPRNGGAAVACIELCAAMVERGHYVEIFTTAIDIPDGWNVETSHPFVHRGVVIHFFPIWGTEYYWISPALVIALWRRIKEFDVIHIHSLYRFHLPVTAWFCRFFDRPYIVKPHGSLDPFLFRWRRWRKLPHEFLFDKPAYTHAAAIHYVADEERRLAETTKMLRGLKKTSVVVPSAVIVPEGVGVGVGVDISAIDVAAAKLLVRFPALRDKVIVLFLGRLNFKKGIDILVDAFAEVRKSIPNAHLLFVGPDSDGYSRQIDVWINRHQLAEHTTFTGMLQGIEKFAAFRIASVFVLPSYTENFGIAIIEAMTQRRPVVISNKVNIWREIENANAGLVTDCDSGQTAEAILRILRDPALAATLSQNGFRLAHEHFTWQAAAKKMDEVYTVIVAKGLHPMKAKA